MKSIDRMQRGSASEEKEESAFQADKPVCAMKKMYETADWVISTGRTESGNGYFLLLLFFIKGPVSGTSYRKHLLCICSRF